jgi:hypothetical protein
MERVHRCLKDHLLSDRWLFATGLDAGPPPKSLRMAIQNN